MERFVEMVQKLDAMAPEIKARLIDKYRTLCTCPLCPTYTVCMKKRDEKLFCSTGKTACTAVKKACICPTCPVTSIMALKFGYYCTNGSERQHRNM
ncbi:MAG: DUF2769 domain-containing protein [Methanoregula sp.]